MFRNNDRHRLFNYLKNAGSNKISSGTTSNDTIIRKKAIIQHMKRQHFNNCESKIDDSNKTEINVKKINNVHISQNKKHKIKKNKSKKPIECNESDETKSDIKLKSAKKQIKLKSVKANNVKKHNKTSTLERSLMLEVENKIAELKRNYDNLSENDEEEDFDIDEEETKPNKNIKSKINERDELSRRSLELANRARQTLNVSMFRSLNEYLYSHNSSETGRDFTNAKFRLYHSAYDKLMEQWPLKPIDYLIKVLKDRIPDSKLTKTTIADVGCGSHARIAEAFPNATVHSFDLHKNDPNDPKIISANMTHLPLDSEQCDFIVYSLSLMPTNLKDCIREANRILKMNGYMLVVEVASRFADYQSTSGRNLITEKHVGHRFALDLKSYGFQLVANEELKPNAFFVYFCFKKTGDVEKLMPKSKLPPITLKACAYKSR